MFERLAVELGVGADKRKNVIIAFHIVQSAEVTANIDAPKIGIITA